MAATQVVNLGAMMGSLLCFCAGLLAAGVDVDQRGDAVKMTQDGATMTGSTVKLSEEESLSKAIPAQHRCNVCKAIVFQLSEGFRALGKRRLKDWETEEVYEQVCEGTRTTWQKYGARDIEGNPELTGPGLLNPAPTGGNVVVTSTGGVWADRLKMACLQMVDEVGESEMYKLYMRDGTYEGIDEMELCVRRQKSCQQEELDYFNQKIEQQKRLDAGRTVQSADSKSGYQGQAEAKKVTKPVEEARSGKGGKPAKTTTTTTTTTTAKRIKTTTTTTTTTTATKATVGATSRSRHQTFNDLLLLIEGLDTAQLEKALSYVQFLKREEL